jgi:hypothetical protein
MTTVLDLSQRVQNDPAELSRNNDDPDELLASLSEESRSELMKARRAPPI